MDGEHGKRGTVFFLFFDNLRKRKRKKIDLFINEFYKIYNLFITSLTLLLVFVWTKLKTSELVHSLDVQTFCY